MLQDENEIRASLRLAVADVPPPRVFQPGVTRRRAWWPVVATAASVVTVVAVAGIAVRRDSAPVAGDPPVVQAVPFVDRPAAMTAHSMGIRQPPPAGTPDCAASDLAVGRIDNRPFAHRRNVIVHLRNVSARMCAVTGHPEFELVDAAGRVVDVPIHMGGSGFGEPRRMGIPPDRIVRVDAEWNPWCQADPGPMRMRLRPAGGGEVLTEPAFEVPACTMVPNVATEGAPGGGRLLVREWISEEHFAGPMTPLEVRVEAPASARRGESLEFSVLLVNNTDAAIPVRATHGGRANREGPTGAPSGIVVTPVGEPGTVMAMPGECPIYVMRLDVLPSGGVAAPGQARAVQQQPPWLAAFRQLYLNCDVAKEIPARSAIRLEMRLDVPETLPAGRGWLTWNLDVSGEIAAPDGRPSHDVWVELDIVD